MADTKITALAAITTVDPAADVLPIVDISDTSMAASGTTKKITSNQILGAGGTATLASATITGDLTVDTNVLKVDSANNRVGIGTATPGRALDVIGTEYISSQLLVGTTTVPSGSAVRVAINGTSGSDSYYQFSNGSGGGGSIGSSGGAGVNLYTFTGVVGSETTTKRLTVDSNGVFTFENVGGVAGTAMTLNSTGLGVGASPSYKLDVQKTSDGTVGYFRRIGATINPALTLYCNETGNTVGFGTDYAGATSPAITFTTAGAERFRIDASGNVGVGVTPSGSGGCLQIKSGITFPATQVASTDANTLDDYEEGTWVPVITSGSGTPTTVTVNSAVYTKVGRVVVCAFDFSIVDKGTASSSLQFGLPFTSITTTAFCGSFREDGSTGNMGMIIYSTGTTAGCLLYNNATPWVNGYRLKGTYTYFAS